MKVEFNSKAGFIKVEGVGISLAFIESLLNNPPKDCLISFRRVGDQMFCTTHQNLASCAEFFAGKAS